VRGVVTGRFHTACFALGLEVPMVVVASNTPKIEAVLADAGLDLARRVVPSTELDSVRDVPPFTPEEALSLRRFLEATRAAHRAMFSDLQSLVPGTR
jgi:polysaccharide pyruvyl transferase WcaK-like protein